MQTITVATQNTEARRRLTKLKSSCFSGFIVDRIRASVRASSHSEVLNTPFLQTISVELFLLKFLVDVINGKSQASGRVHQKSLQNREVVIARASFNSIQRRRTLKSARDIKSFIFSSSKLFSLSAAARSKQSLMNSCLRISFLEMSTTDLSREN